MKDYFTTLSIKSQTHRRIRNEADATGMKMWVIVDNMAENYFEKARMEA